MTSTAETIPLWPDNTLTNMIAHGGDAPTLSMFAPEQAIATGAAVIVLPGGGYVVHAEHEAEPVAEWLRGLGITAFVLRYRLHPHGKHPAALADAARAIRVVRANAASFGVDPQRIGVLGFSAGGHLASMLATLVGSADMPGGDDLAHINARPDLHVLIYPVISLRANEGHEWCGEALFGRNAKPALLQAHSTHLRVTSATPPAFLMHAADDTVSVANSLLYATALQAQNVPFALHISERGGHGFGLGTGDALVDWWPKHCAAWLNEHGF